MNPQRLLKIWYEPGTAVPPHLRLLSWLFAAVTALRRGLYRLGLMPRYRPRVPVIVVGNLTVGGSGKTPLVVWLAQTLRDAGLRPGVVSRGYGGQARHWPQQVRADSDPHVVGDEAVMLARHCDCPMAVGPDRKAAVRALLDHTDVNIIVSDDGLQHYGLARDVEICVIDGDRRLGNGLLVPAGPLREPAERLRRVDFRIVNGGKTQDGEIAMELVMKKAHKVNKPTQTRPLSRFTADKVHAVAGIGNPQRFFKQLKAQKLKLSEHPFADHHPFTAEDIQFGDEREVLMTEKDAVKCERFAGPNHWYVMVETDVAPEFRQQLIDCLEKKIAAKGQQWINNYSTSLSAPSAKDL